MKTDRIVGTNGAIENAPLPPTRKGLIRKVRKQPGNVVLLASLADVYLAEGAYGKAIEVSGKAYALAPTNPLVLWDHARSLYMNRRFADAVVLHKRILKKRVATIARSMRWPDEMARQFQNTSRFDLALCYVQLDRLAFAAKMLRDYIAQCPRVACYYSPDLARAKLRSLDRLRSQAERQAVRLWISLVEIKVLTVGRRSMQRRGFTNALTMARTRNEAIAILRADLTEMGYKLIRAEDTEEFDRRMLKTELPDSTRELAEEVYKHKTTRFTDFCMYPSR
jgi:tetratricopeptide (TPR) repeat protein